MTGTALLRLFAYPIAPKGSTDAGGEIRRTKALRDALDAAYRAAKLDAAMPISLSVDRSTRTCPMRNAVISLAFDRSSVAAQAARSTAERLAAAMDQRSKPCLFVITVRGEPKGQTRQVVLWTFPQDEVF